MGQRFAARERREFSNGAIGWAPGGSFDCLGPYAKVQNCPIVGTTLRRTCYASAYADTFFSIPAHFTICKRTIRGFFSVDDDGAVVFHPLTTHKHLIPKEYSNAPTDRA
jgi:hypothetical protein